MKNVLAYSLTQKTSSRSHYFMRNQLINRLQKWLRWVERILARRMMRLPIISRKEEGRAIILHLRRRTQRKHMPLQQLQRIREEKVKLWMSNSWQKTVRDRLRAISSKVTTRNRPWHKSTPKTPTKIRIASEMLEHQTPLWWTTQTPITPICSIVNL